MSNINKLPDDVNPIKAYHELAEKGIHNNLYKDCRIYLYTHPEEKEITLIDVMKPALDLYKEILDSILVDERLMYEILNVIRMYSNDNTLPPKVYELLKAQRTANKKLNN